MRAGFKTIKGAWQYEVGFSDRTLGDLERGNPVGDKVLVEVERVLRWPDRWTLRILDGKADGPPPETAVLRDRESVTVADASYDELLAELSYRNKTGFVTS